MSFYMSLSPYAYLPAAAVSNPAAAAAYLPAAQTASSAAVSTAAANVATTSASAASVHASAASTVTLSPAFTAVAVPLAVTVMAVLVTGMTIDMVKFNRKLFRENTMVVPTVFSDKKTLINAIYAYDKNRVCTIYESDDGTLTARMELEDYIFEPDPGTGFYRLTIRNAGTCERMLEQINTLQQAYIEAVRTETYNRLRQSAQRNGWSIESEERAQDGTMTLRVMV